MVSFANSWLNDIDLDMRKRKKEMDLVEMNATNLKVTLMKIQSLTDEFSDEEGVRSTSRNPKLG